MAVPVFDLEGADENEAVEGYKSEMSVAVRGHRPHRPGSANNYITLSRQQVAIF